MCTARSPVRDTRPPIDTRDRGRRASPPRRSRSPVRRAERYVKTLITLIMTLITT